MRKLNTMLVAFGLLLATLTACDDEDTKVNRVHSGSGIWAVEEIRIERFDTTGKLLETEVTENAGELVLFETGSLSLLFGFYQGVFIDHLDSVKGKVGYTLEYRIDGTRSVIQSMSFDPHGLGGVYTIKKFGRQNQEWFNVSMHPRGEFLINTKKTIVLKKKGYN